MSGRGRSGVVAWCVRIILTSARTTVIVARGDGTKCCLFVLCCSVFCCLCGGSRTSMERNGRVPRQRSARVNVSAAKH